MVNIKGALFVTGVSASELDMDTLYDVYQSGGVPTLRGYLEKYYPNRSIVVQEIKVGTVDHPRHYNSHPSGVECITITEHFNFNIGNAVKYLWRAGLKGEELEDLEKAAWYVSREIERLKNA